MMKLPRTRGINTNRRAYDNHIHVSFLSFTPRLHQHRRRCTQFAKSRPTYRDGSCSFDNSAALSGGESETKHLKMLQKNTTIFYSILSSQQDFFPSSPFRNRNSKFQRDLSKNRTLVLNLRIGEETIDQRNLNRARTIRSIRSMTEHRCASAKSLAQSSHRC